MNLRINAKREEIVSRQDSLNQKFITSNARPEVKCLTTSFLHANGNASDEAYFKDLMQMGWGWYSHNPFLPSPGTLDTCVLFLFLFR